MFYELLERFVGLGAEDTGTAGGKGWHAGDAHLAGFGPVFVDGCFEAAVFEDFASFGAI